MNKWWISGQFKINSFLPPSTLVLQVYTRQMSWYVIRSVHLISGLRRETVSFNCLECSHCFFYSTILSEYICYLTQPLVWQICRVENAMETHWAWDFIRYMKTSAKKYILCSLHHHTLIFTRNKLVWWKCFLADVFIFTWKSVANWTDWHNKRKTKNIFEIAPLYSTILTLNIKLRLRMSSTKVCPSLV